MISTFWLGDGVPTWMVESLYLVDNDGVNYPTSAGSPPLQHYGCQWIGCDRIMYIELQLQWDLVGI